MLARVTVAAATLALLAFGATAHAQSLFDSFIPDVPLEDFGVGGRACLEQSATPEEIAASCTAVLKNGTQPAKLIALIGRGGAYINLGRREEAISDFSELIRRDPTSVLGYQSRGIARTELGQYDTGLEDLLTAVKLAPTSPAMHNSLCWALVIQGEDLKRALDYCNIGVGLMTGWPAVRDSRALVHLKMGKPDLALADYDVCIKQRPGYGHYLYGRAISLKRLGREVEATKERDEALKADPNVEAKYNSYGVAW